jgi:hypothetical protein
MRLQHVTQAVQGLPTRDAAQVKAKELIAEETERLRWRLWHDKVTNAEATIDRIRTVMRAYRGEQHRRGKLPASRQLWGALSAFNKYVASQSAWLANYGERYRRGLRVGTVMSEGAANYLVNRRMNKSQQMRWTRRGADLLLQVRCAIYNGTLASVCCHGVTQIVEAETKYRLVA